MEERRHVYPVRMGGCRNDFIRFFEYIVPNAGIDQILFVKNLVHLVEGVPPKLLGHFHIPGMPPVPIPQWQISGGGIGSHDMSALALKLMMVGSVPYPLRRGKQDDFTAWSMVISIHHRSEGSGLQKPITAFYPPEPPSNSRVISSSLLPRFSNKNLASSAKSSLGYLARKSS